MSRVARLGAEASRDGALRAPVCTPKGNPRAHTHARTDIMSAEQLNALGKLEPSALRERLPELFACIDAASEDDSPLVASLAERAFNGEEGLVLLRKPECLPFVLHGVAHADSQVRSLTILQLHRLAASKDDIGQLVAQGVLSKIAAAVGDGQLKVAERASCFFAACAAAGEATLAAALGDPATLAALTELGGGGGGDGGGGGRGGSSVLRLRALALFASLAASGDAQFGLVASRGLLEPVLALWRGPDALVRLNAVELLATLASTRAGVDWLRSSGVLEELCACLDIEPGEDPMEDLQRPAVLGCLARILEAGGPPASHALVGEQRLARRLWPMLKRGVPHEQLCAGLACLCAAAAAPAGMRDILGFEGAGLSEGGEGAGALGRTLSAHEERTRVSAMAVAAQLAATFADTVSRSQGGPGAMEVDHQSGEQPPPATALQPAMEGLIAACSPSPSTTPADAIANMARSLSDELRVAALGLLRSLALVEWGALALCASEGVLELLLTSEQVHAVPAEELRLKHSIAQAMMAWQTPQAEAILGPTTSKALRAYATTGPFAPQRPRPARMAAPLTL